MNREVLAAKVRKIAAPGQDGDRDRELANSLDYGYSYRYRPQASEAELIAEAEARVNGSGPNLLPPPSAPMQVARKLIAADYTHPEGLTLRHWRGAWMRWERSRWVEVEDRAIRADAYKFTEAAVYLDKDDVKPWAPNRHKIANLLEATAAVAHLPEGLAQPSWIEGAEAGTIVACANGLLDVEGRELLAHTPRYFNTCAVPFAYDSEAPHPGRWFGFLNDLWPEDADSIAALQEWFGYIVSGWTHLHKILLLVGPTRAGKGAIARVLGAMIGRENVAGPTLSSLGGDFGLAPLLGKSLAVVSDARLTGRNHERRRGAPARNQRRGRDHGQPQVPRPVDREAAEPLHGHLERAPPPGRCLAGDRGPVRRPAPDEIVA